MSLARKFLFASGNTRIPGERMEHNYVRYAFHRLGGKNILFDFNFYYMGITAAKCFELACDEELAPGVYYEIGFPVDENSALRAVGVASRQRADFRR